mmetsp:Transcript_33244/g.88267  ORF Transcript_33244/g.88267 Transcript_33244/m.88267 type:complete len:80 (-) Transcript_33244:657-896(-)
MLSKEVREGVIPRAKKRQDAAACGLHQRMKKKQRSQKIHSRLQKGGGRPLSGKKEEHVKSSLKTIGGKQMSDDSKIQRY